MSLELYDFEAFAESGAMFAIILIAGILLVVQTVFAFLLWQKGEDKYFLKFINLIFAAVAVIVGGAVLAGMITWMGESESLLYFAIVVLGLAGSVSVGIPVYVYIRDKFFPKEETPLKEAKA